MVHTNASLASFSAASTLYLSDIDCEACNRPAKYNQITIVHNHRIQANHYHRFDINVRGYPTKFHIIKRRMMWSKKFTLRFILGIKLLFHKLQLHQIKQQGDTLNYPTWIEGYEQKGGTEPYPYPYSTESRGCFQKMTPTCRIRESNR